MARILVTDDDFSLAAMAQRALTHWGHEVTVVHDAEAALVAAEDTDFELVLSDIHMPGMTGLELLRRIRALHPNAEVVLMTAFSAVPDAVGAIRDGAFDYLPKPFDLETLKKTTDLALARNRQRRANRFRVACPVCKKVANLTDDDRGNELICTGCDSEMPVPASRIGPGICLADFRIIRPLGVGSMGEVYLAEQLSLGRQVAIKVLSETYSASPKVLAYFRNEMKTLAGLEHPNLVPVHYSGKELDIQFFAMAYVDGETAMERLRRQGPSNEREVIALAIAVAQALEYAWGESRVLHRDVKPHNVMYDTINERIKLVDLGIAVCQHARPDEGPDALIGSPYFMSPEQLRSEADLDVRSDVFALGATMYALLTGRTPYADQPMSAIAATRTRQAPIPLAAKCPQLRPPFVDLVERMMAEDRDDRPRSWGTVLCELELLQLSD